MTNYSKEEILEMVEDEGVQFIRLQFTGFFGVLKNVAIPATKLCKALDNRCSIDRAALEGFSDGEEVDLYLKPDLSTFSILPWRPQQGKVARLLCDVVDENGHEYEGSSRYILKRVVEEVAKKGYTFSINPECEFYLFHVDDNGLPTTITHERAGYLDTSPIDLGENTRRDIILSLEDMGYEIDSSHHEISPAQHEIDFTFENALKTADKIVTFKMAVRTIAKRYGLQATFMPKPKEDANGSAMHVNMRLMKDGRNVLADANGELSQEGKAFMAGILNHIPGMTAILNPIVNSYKRLIPGTTAPTDITWSRKQRNALIHARKHISGSLDLELRSPDATADPYLVFALCLAAGMDGIEKNMTAHDEITEDIRNLSEDEKYERGIDSLPENLGEALKAMKKDELVCETLGLEFADRYMKAKRKEWKGYLEQISDWEIERYLYLV